jgi:hypothetical protein
MSLYVFDPSKSRFKNLSPGELPSYKYKSNWEKGLEKKSSFHKPIDCNKEESRRLRPECTNNPNEKKRRQVKINKVMGNFAREVGSEMNPILQNKKHIYFVRRLHKDSNQDKRWIYEHYLHNAIYDPINRKKMPIVLSTSKYINNPLKLTKTWRQTAHIRARTGNGDIGDVYQQIEAEYKRNDHQNPILNNINQLFLDIQIVSKTEFNYDFDTFFRKLMIMKMFLERNRLTINNFYNETIRFNIIQNEKKFHEIFSKPKRAVFQFLKDNHILTEQMFKLYYAHFTHKLRNITKITMIDFADLYENIIKTIFNLLITVLPNSPSLFDFIQNDIQRIGLPNSERKNKYKKMINEYFTEKIILPCIRKYLFFINCTLKNHFDQKEYIFEACYEDFYYVQLYHNLHFIQSFLGCLDLSIYDNMEQIGFGAQADTFRLFKRQRINSANTRIPTGNIIKITKKPVLEKIYFEFFKQLCLYQSLIGLLPGSSLIPYSEKFILGKKNIYIEMNEIYGSHILQYYIDFVDHYYPNPDTQNRDPKSIEDQTLNNIEKKRRINQRVLNILKIIAKIIEKCQYRNFVHFDLNLKNIMVTYDKSIKYGENGFIENELNINQIRLIDFDFSLIYYNNLYIFNYSSQIDYSNSVFKRDLGLTEFIKSTDLNRTIMYYFIFVNYIKKYVLTNKPNDLLQKYELDESFKIILRANLYGISDFLMPTQLYNDIFKEKTLDKFPKQFIPSLYSNKKYIRNEVFKIMEGRIKPTQQIRAQMERWNQWKRYYNMWITPFLPVNFISILNSICI